MSYKNTLHDNQRRAITALLKHSTIAAAAEDCQLTERTLYRYLDDETFRVELSRREGIALGLATRRLLTMVDKALDALESVLERPEQRGAGNKRMAAKTVIDSLLKVRELVTLEQRISELERMANVTQK